MGTNTLTGLNIEFPIYNSDGSSFYGLVLRRATFDSIVMSLGDKITGDVVYSNNALPVSMGEYIMFAGVKYTLVNPPTVVREGLAKDNSDLNGMTKYSFEFYHPMYQLGNLPFSDVAVSSDQQRYLSENKVFSWIGKPDDYIAKLNKNLENTQWVVVKSNEFPVEKLNVLSDVLSFDKATIADALKTWYDTWGIPYVVDTIDESDPLYAQGKRFKVVMGLPSNEILDSDDNPYIFEMGQGVGLKNNSRTPKNNKIVTRIAPYGSERNIPYGYPQIVWTGNQDWEYTIENDPTAENSYPIYDGIVGGQNVRLIKHPFTRKTLMPSIYATLVNKKVNPNATGYDPTIELVDYYDATSEEHYPNPINPLAPSYEAHEFSDIYPRLDEKSILSAEPYDTLKEQGVDGYVAETAFLGTVLNNSTSTTNSQERTALLGLYNALNSGSATYHAESQSGDDYQYVCDVTSDSDFYYVKYTSSNINYDVILLKTGHSVPVASSWNDKMDDEGNYVQSYFKITLPLLNFDMYACASITEDMKIYMRSGACIGCTFNVAVDWDDYKKNFYDEDGKFAPEGSQRDLTKYPKTNEGSVTIIVQKDIDTFGTLMPNIYQQPTTGDEFVVLGISLPLTYITDAEAELDTQSKQYMLENNVYYYEYPLKFDEHFLAKNIDILKQIKPNSIVRFKYNGEQDNIVLYVKQMTVKYGQGVLPQYDITVTDDIEVVLNKIGQVTDDVSRMRFDIARLMQLYTEGVNIDAINRLISEKLSKIEDDTAQGFIRFMQGIQVGERFVSGILGEGGVFRRNADGKVYLETDNLYVRMKAYFDTVEIRHYKHSTGNRIASNAGIHCSRVVWIDASGNQTEDIDSAVKFRCYFRATDGEDTVANYFVAASNGTQDLAFCDKTTVESGVNNRRYWRAVVGKNAVLTDDGEAWIDLSKSDCESGSDIPMAGDDIIQLGNKTDTERQGAIIEYVNGNDAPSYQIYQGINSYSLENKNIIRIGFNSSTGRAEMNVYGDAYIGDPNGSTFVKYEQYNSATHAPKLTIKAEMDIQSTFGGQTLQARVEEYAPEYDDSWIQPALDELQDQIDGAIETWFYDGVPTLSNLPASQWSTTDDKKNHLGDLYYDNRTGYAYRFSNTGTEQNPQFEWKKISDQDVTKALADAAKAQATADGKMTIYSLWGAWVKNSVNTLQVGDLFIPANDTTQGGVAYKARKVYKCTTTGQNSFSEINYTDDSALYNFVSNTYNPFVTNIQGQVDGKAETWRQDTNPANAWTTDADKIKHIGDLWMDTSSNGGKKTYIYVDKGSGASPRYAWEAQDVPDSVFDEIDSKASIFVSQPSNYKANDLWILAADTVVDGVSYKQGEVLTSSADSETYVASHWTKKVRYTDDTKYNNFINALLNGMPSGSDETTVEAALNAIKAALNQGTTIDGGLVLSTLIGLRDGNSRIWSGINGAYQQSETGTGYKGHGIAAWYGGAMVDKEVVTTATDYAKSLFRFDGSGYLSGGNITWDKNGNASIKGELDARISGVGGWLIAPRLNASLGVPAIEGYNNSNTLVFSLQFDGDENGGTSLYYGGGLYMYDSNGSPISRYTRRSWQINHEDTSSNTWSYMVASAYDDEANIRGFYQFNQQSEQKQYYFDIGVDSKGIILQAQKWPALNELIEPDDWHRVFVDGYGLVRVKGVNDSFVPQGSSQAIVTSVGLSAPTGFQVSNSPITTSGNIVLSFASGYSLPTTAKQSNWDTAYGWGNHANAGYLTSNSLSGYATQSWVTSQLAGYATQSWVWESLADDTNEQIASSHLTTALSAYATITQLGNYLRLTGGTLTGGLNISDGSHGYAQLFVDEDGLNIMTGSLTGTQQLYTGRIYSDSTIEATGNITGFSFIKAGGTSSQFLKADGSVDSTAYLPKQGSSFYFITDADMPETAANISTLNAAHRMTLYRNAILMPYMANDANDGGFIRSRGTSESSAIFEIGMWDDSGAGETIQFNYYPTTSTINPTYSISVPKKSGTIALTSDLASYNPTTNFKTINNQSIIGTGNINIEGGGTLYDAEVEYIEGTGTQWIETGIRFDTTKHGYIVDATLINDKSGTVTICGVWEGNWDNNHLNCAMGGNYLSRYFSCPPSNFRGGNVGESLSSPNVRSVIGFINHGLSNGVINVTRYVNGSSSNITMTNPYIGTSIQTIPIFGMKGNGQNVVSEIPHLKLYGFKMYDGDTIIMDLIPVRVGQVGYMYDKVSGELFGNSGTGSFVLGQDTGPGGGLPYLPLTGGTITGNLTVNGAVKFNSNLTFAYDRGIYFGTDNSVKIMRAGYRLVIANEAGDDIIIGDYNNSNCTSIVNDLQGCTSNSAYIVGAPTWYIHNDGTAQFKSVSQTSDLRKKTITGDVPMNLYNVANAPLFKFTWNNETKFSGQHIGSAAQYWQTVLPELVSIGRDTDMTLAMQYDVIALASAITVAKTVVNHDERIKILENENKSLKEEIELLKNKS